MGFLIEDRQYGFNNSRREETRFEQMKLGGGAQFWVYVSPSNDTARYLNKWQVKIEQQDESWSGIITSENPRQSLQTPGLSGIFKLTVVAELYNGAVAIQLQPQAGSQSDVGCDANCAAMIGIVLAPGGGIAKYWTVWNAFCRRSSCYST